MSKKYFLLMILISLQSCSIVGSFSENIESVFHEIIFFAVFGVIGGFIVMIEESNNKKNGKDKEGCFIPLVGAILLGLVVSIYKCSNNKLDNQKKIIETRYNSTDLPSDDLKKVYDYKVQLTEQNDFLDNKSNEIQNTINDFSDKLLYSKKEFNLIIQNNKIYSYDEAAKNSECVKLLEHIQRRYTYISKCTEILNNAKFSSMAIRNLLIKTDDDILLLQTLNEDEREKIIDNLNTQIENFDENNFIINSDNLDVVPLENIFNQLKNE